MLLDARYYQSKLFFFHYCICVEVFLTGFLHTVGIARYQFSIQYQILISNGKKYCIKNVKYCIVSSKIELYIK